MAPLVIIALACCLAVIIVALLAQASLARVIEVLTGLFLVLGIAALLKYLGLVG